MTYAASLYKKALNGPRKHTSDGAKHLNLKGAQGNGL